MSDRPKYHEEIDRICDIAVAEENTRLAEGGLGPGDEMTEGAVIEHDGQQYLDLAPLRERERSVQELMYQDGKDGLLQQSDRDEYRELIEAPAPTEEEPAKSVTTGDAIKYQLDEIRSRIMSYPPNVRLDVGFLLEVIDAYEGGRL